MVMFSRAFIRKRVISLATTASVTATSFALAQDPARTHHVRRGIQYVADRHAESEGQSYRSENDVAMHKIMAGMMIKPGGDIDRYLVEMMLPHRQGAVDMAKAELKYGRDEPLHRLARQIVATQQREITVMQNAAREGRSSSAQSLEQPRTVVPQLDSIDGSAAHDGTGMSR
jgi:uncharacterized protein (DUF305 family)